MSIWHVYGGYNLSTYPLRGTELPLRAHCCLRPESNALLNLSLNVANSVKKSICDKSFSCTDVLLHVMLIGSVWRVLFTNSTNCLPLTSLNFESPLHVSMPQRTMSQNG